MVRILVKKVNVQLKLTSEQMDKLGEVLSSRDWPSRKSYARHAFDGDGVKVVAYEAVN